MTVQQVAVAGAGAFHNSDHAILRVDGILRDCDLIASIIPRGGDRRPSMASRGTLRSTEDSGEELSVVYRSRKGDRSVALEKLHLVFLVIFLV